MNMNTLDEKGLYDIYSAWHIPFWQTNWFYWTIAGLIGIVITLIVVAFIRAYLRRKKPPLTYWEKALQEIARLQQKKYTTKEEGKQCYFVLTSVLKIYLNKRFQFPTAGKTDDEVVCYIEKKSLDENIKLDLNDILKGCLLIKFANQQAMEKQIHEHITIAFKLIKATLPQSNS